MQRLPSRSIRLLYIYPRAAVFISAAERAVTRQPFIVP